MSGSIGTTGFPAPKAYTNIGGVGPTGLGQPAQFDNSGNLKTAVSGSITASNPSVGPNGSPAPVQSTEIGTIDGSGNLQGVSSSNPLPISAPSLPLPTGASTSALQTTGNNTLTTINSTLGSPFQAGGSIGNTSFAVSNFPATQPVSGTVTVVQSTGTNLHAVIDSSALPTGASTSANQSTEITALGTINTTLGSPFQAGGSIGNSSFGISGSLPAGSNAIGSVSVSNFPATQPVSGTVAVSNFPSTTPPASPFTGQQTSTGTAVAIAASQALVNGVIVQALSGNINSVYVGPSGITSSTGFELQPGQATSTAVSNLNAVYVISTHSGDGICYIGS